MRCYSWKTKAKNKEKRIMADYSTETFEVRRGKKDVSQALRDHNFQPEII